VKRIVFTLIMILGVAGFAAAQITSPTQDVLGAHNVYGRGCAACHAPHSGAAGNGGKSSANSGNLALWGQDLSPLYGKSLTFGSNHSGGGYVVTLPNYSTSSFPSDPGDGYFSLIACLSCHDGNVAKTGMMRGTSVETVTISGATFNPPTLLGNDGSTPGNYSNDHPVGPQATFGCDSSPTGHNWDCTVNADGSITFGGPRGKAFIANYFDVTNNGPVGNLVQIPGTTTSGTRVTSNSWVTCITCHDQHDMTYFNTGAAIKPTHFFVRAWYDPGNSATSNSAAQFCRSCHGGESNEANGQMSVPTT